MLTSDQPLVCQSSDPKLWFSKRKRDIERAQALCHSCLERQRCLSDTLALEELLGERLQGVHGGLTPAERTNVALRQSA